MPIVLVIFILILIGVGLYVLHMFAAPKMDRRYVTLIDIIVILCTIVWLINLIAPGVLKSSSNGCNPAEPVPTITGSKKR